MAKKRQVTEESRNRVVLSPNDEQKAVFEQQMQRSGHTKMATWALARLWQAVQEDLSRRS